MLGLDINFENLEDFYKKFPALKALRLEFEAWAMYSDVDTNFIRHVSSLIGIISIKKAKEIVVERSRGKLVIDRNLQTQWLNFGDYTP